MICFNRGVELWITELGVLRSKLFMYVHTYWRLRPTICYIHDSPKTLFINTDSDDADDFATLLWLQGYVIFSNIFRLPLKAPAEVEWALGTLSSTSARGLLPPPPQDHRVLKNTYTGSIGSRKGRQCKNGGRREEDLCVFAEFLMRQRAVVHRKHKRGRRRRYFCNGA